MKTYLAYCRASGRITNPEDCICRQQDLIQEYAKSKGCEIQDGDWFYDVYPERRKAFKEMLKRLKDKNIRGLFVSEVDRFSRKIEDFKLMGGKELIAIKNPPSDKEFIEALIQAFAMEFRAYL